MNTLITALVLITAIAVALFVESTSTSQSNTVAGGNSVGPDGDADVPSFDRAAIGRLMRRRNSAGRFGRWRANPVNRS